MTSALELDSLAKPPLIVPLEEMLRLRTRDGAYRKRPTFALATDWARSFGRSRRGGGANPGSSTQRPGSTRSDSATAYPTPSYAIFYLPGDEHPCRALGGAGIGALIEVEGIGFFDYVHGQRGMARNGFELQPVLGLRVVGGAIAFDAARERAIQSSPDRPKAWRW